MLFAPSKPKNVKNIIEHATQHVETLVGCHIRYERAIYSAISGKLVEIRKIEGVVDHIRYDGDGYERSFNVPQAVVIYNHTNDCGTVVMRDYVNASWLYHEGEVQ